MIDDYIYHLCVSRKENGTPKRSQRRETRAIEPLYSRALDNKDPSTVSTVCLKRYERLTATAKQS
jgi:hypothetical protein